MPSLALSSLVRSGVYRSTRNPMYLGFAIALAGWAVFLEHPLALLGVVAFVAYMNRSRSSPKRGR